MTIKNFSILFVVSMVGCFSNSLIAKENMSLTKSKLNDEYLQSESDSYLSLAAASEFNTIVLLIRDNPTIFASDVLSTDFVATIKKNISVDQRLSRIKIENNRIFDSSGAEIFIRTYSGNRIVVKRVSAFDRELPNGFIVEVMLDRLTGELVKVTKK